MGEKGAPTKPGKYIVGLPVPGAAGILISLVLANHADGRRARLHGPKYVVGDGRAHGLPLASSWSRRSSSGASRTCKLNARTFALVVFAVGSSAHREPADAAGLRPRVAALVLRRHRPASRRVLSLSRRAARRGEARRSLLRAVPQRAAGARRSGRHDRRALRPARAGAHGAGARRRATAPLTRLLGGAADPRRRSTTTTPCSARSREVLATDAAIRRGALTVIEVLWPSNDRVGVERARSALLPHVPPVDRARTLAAQGDMADAARETEERGARRGGRDSTARRPATGPRRGALGRSPLVAASPARCAERGGRRRTSPRSCSSTSRGAPSSAATRRSAARRSSPACGCSRRRPTTSSRSGSASARSTASRCSCRSAARAGAFEDVLEGYVNCIRILREDHLKYFALQYYDEAIAAATERGEAGAAATLAREAADYARSLGLAPRPARYALRQAELWRDVGQAAPRRAARPPRSPRTRSSRRSSPSARSASSRASGELYAELAELDLEPARREHYARASQRYASVKDEPLEPRPRRPPIPCAQDSTSSRSGTST